MNSQALDWSGAFFALCATLVVAGCGSRHDPPSAVQHPATSFDEVKQMAEQMARTAQPLPVRIAKPFLELDYDTYRMIAPRHDTALWRDEGLPYWLEFFPAGFIYPYAVEMSVVSDGREEPIQYSDRWLQYRGDVAPLATTPGGGFAGFRLLSQVPGEEHKTEFLVFLGASYFRGIGHSQQYGASARGLAIDIGLPTPEEFPRFTKFWFEKPSHDLAPFRFWALLDGPAVVGAYRFQVERGRSTTVDVEAHLWFRHGVQKVGVAPLTSMWMWNAASRPAGDTRPQVHDSDGLLIHDGDQWLWRNLSRPAAPRVSQWQVEKLAGFGLLQRDRKFEHYGDKEANYDKRPSLWVTPASDWGRGRVELLELPAPHEGMDNIGAYWVPDETPAGGAYRQFVYRVDFGLEPEEPAQLARVVDAHVGEMADGTSLVGISFQGVDESMATTNGADTLQPVVHCQTGVADGIQLLPTGTGGRVLTFRYVPAAEHAKSIDAYLTFGTDRVSEVWSYR
jgi:glucans biosynthesis protein